MCRWKEAMTIDIKRSGIISSTNARVNFYDSSHWSKRWKGCHNNVPFREILHAKNDDDATMIMRRKLAELMVMIVSQIQRKCIIPNKKGEPMIFMSVQKELYGMLKSSLLFYKKLRKDLEDYGFTINPYDPCGK